MSAPTLDELISRVLREHPGAPVVFDADGTLWRGDVGEDFLRYGIAIGLFPGSYAHYERLLAHGEVAAAYAWCVELLAGLPEKRVSQEAESFFAGRYAGRVFPYVRPLLTRLKAAGHPAWICSASPRLAVLPGARHLGIPEEQVIGVTCPVQAGVFTGVVELPVPVGAGKVAWLQRLGVRPALAVGNGDFDLDMLADARNALVVTPPDSTNHLVREARSRSWTVLVA